MVLVLTPVLYPREVSWIDIVIAVVVATSALRGRSSGALRQVSSVLGFVVGFLIGTMVAPNLAHALASGAWRPVVAIVIVVVGASLGASLGGLVGSAAKVSMRRLKLGALDAAAGAAVGTLGSLFACWLLAGLVATAPWASLGSHIGSSRILATLDAVMPPIPSVETRVIQLFRTSDFPSVFANVVAPSVAAVEVSSPDQATAMAAAARPSVHRILATGNCSADHEGTGFVVASGLVITNAHVVAGSAGVTVDGRRGQVVLFDPNQDVAVISVSTLSWPVLRLASGPLSLGPAAVVGFPLNGALSIAPAGVAGEVSAATRDIYASTVLARSMIVVNGDVQPGNSGSPLLQGGGVVGMVFSKSLTLPLTAYAITNAVIRSEVLRVTAPRPVSSGVCVSN